MLNRPRILILSANTGGGHNAVAHALQEAFMARLPDATVSVVDGLREGTTWPFNRFDRTHSWMASQARWAMRLMFWADAQPQLTQILYGPGAKWACTGLRQIIRHHQPDVIISVQPHLTQLLARMKKSALKSIPLIAVVTDLVEAPHTCFHSAVDLCLVATEETRRQALALGLAPDQVAVVGLPISLALNCGDPAPPPPWGRLGGGVVLLMGGSQGYGGPMTQIAQAIDKRLTAKHRLIIVTGRNQPLKQELEAMTWRRSVTVLGFVADMPSVLATADVLVTKAGPSSLAEAFAAGLPTILFGHFPGPEASNVRHVVENGAGLYCADPDGIAEILDRWLVVGNHTLLTLSQNAHQLSRPRAALDAVDRIIERFGLEGSDED